MRRPPRSLVWMTVFAIAVAAVLATAPRVAAAQNAPAWTQGDFWVYARTAGSATSTVRIDVNERTTLTLPSGTYNVWHLTTTTTDAGGNSTVQHSWVVDSNLATAKANFTLPLLGEVQVTLDPPQAGAVFPLTAGAQWSLNTTLRVVGVSFSLNIAYSGTVLREQSTSVAAGTFNVAVIRNPSTGTAHSEDQYSDGAGNYVKRESYDGSGNRGRDCPIHRRAPAEARVDAAATRNRPAADATASVGAQALHRPGPRDRACEADPTPRSRWRSSPSRSHRFSSRGATRLRSRSLCTGSPSPRGSSERRS